MASAYAAFAADGKYCPPIVVSSISDRSGKQLPVPTSACTQALEPNVAHGVTYALKQVITRGTARGVGIGRPAAGKTGTTDDSKDTWFIGYTPQRTTAVWVGDNPNPADGRARRSINGRTIGGSYRGQVFGATIAAPIWRTVMIKANEGLPEKDWASPSGKILEGSSVRVPNVVGQSLDAAKAQLESAGFEVTVSDQQVPSNIGPDRVADTSPKPGARVAPKSSITLLPGDGKGDPQGGNGDSKGDGKGDGKGKKGDKNNPDFPDGFPFGNRDGGGDQGNQLKPPITTTKPTKATTR
jgi:membrane peptidoglycan carboxypeptidase